MNVFQQAINSFLGNPKIISPLPASDSPGGFNNPVTNPALNNYYQTDSANAKIGQANPPQTLPDTQQDNPVSQALNILNPEKKSQKVNAQVVQNPQSFQDQMAQVFSQQGVPPAAGLGIWAMEGRGKTINPNNPFNLGAYDSNPQNANAYKFSSPLQGAQEAAKFLAGQSQFMDQTKQKIFQSAIDLYKKTGDVGKYLQMIAPTYSSNPQYAQTVMQTPEFKKYLGN